MIAAHQLRSEAIDHSEGDGAISRKILSGIPAIADQRTTVRTTCSTPRSTAYLPRGPGMI